MKVASSLSLIVITILSPSTALVVGSSSSGVMWYHVRRALLATARDVSTQRARQRVSIIMIISICIVRERERLGEKKEEEKRRGMQETEKRDTAALLLRHLSPPYTLRQALSVLPCFFFFFFVFSLQASRPVISLDSRSLLVFFPLPLSTWHLQPRISWRATHTQTHTHIHIHWPVSSTPSSAVSLSPCSPIVSSVPLTMPCVCCGGGSNRGAAHPFPLSFFLPEKAECQASGWTQR